MADVFPFRGYRYNKEKIADPDKVVTQPYDKIDCKAQDNYYQASDYNIVRLILSKGKPGKDRYQAAAEDLNKWIDEGILVQDEKASFYVYWQEYQINGEWRVRKGFVGMGRLEGEDGVKAHENTLEGPKADRLNLMRATEANFGHIFMLYSDKEQKIITLLDEGIRDKEPLVKVNDEDGNRHILWQITDEGIIESIQELMKDKVLYIADGHHRYQTAVNFRDECLAKGWRSVGAEGFENRMMTFINIDDTGLSILATHRLVHGLPDFDLKVLLEKAADDFYIDKYGTAAELYEKMVHNPENSHIIGLKAKGDRFYYSLTLRDKETMKELLPDKTDDWRLLDVVILHKAVLERYLGIDEEALARESFIEYIRYRDKALDLLENSDKDYQAAFLLNPTPVSAVKKVADQGERMPQKSTDFYPKLLTGLVLNRLNIEK